MKTNFFPAAFFIMMLSLFFSFYSPPVKSQTQVAVLSDTMRNSQKTTCVIGGLADVDSVTLSIYASGEIDIDSLCIQFYEQMQVSYLDGEAIITKLGTKSTTYSKALTTNLADGVTEYTGKIVTIPKSAWQGYNRISAYIIAASSGNDTGDTGQKAVLIVNYYK